MPLVKSHNSWCQSVTFSYSALRQITQHVTLHYVGKHSSCVWILGYKQIDSSRNSSRECAVWTRCDWGPQFGRLSTVLSWAPRVSYSSCLCLLCKAKVPLLFARSISEEEVEHISRLSRDAVWNFYCGRSVFPVRWDQLEWLRQTRHARTRTQCPLDLWLTCGIVPLFAWTALTWSCL